jgi:hypothetical protein
METEAMKILIICSGNECRTEAMTFWRSHADGMGNR